LSEAAAEWVARAQHTLTRDRLTGAKTIEMAENTRGDERACHLELSAGVEPGPFAAIAGGLAGLSAAALDRADAVTLAGSPAVTDTVRVSDRTTLRLRRDVRAFFQGNRFLIDELVRRVVGLVPDGPVIDLYAGVGLFGLALASAGKSEVTLVEGDPVSGADLERNAGPFRERTVVERRSVETFIASARARGSASSTVIVDPPRTGLSRQAAAGIISLRPPRIVYVSCDVATLARDARLLADAGYALVHLSGLDLFPNTAHVETIAVLSAR
jgi:23S rRNA (uracil1939-C5)-methyltransferase